MSSGRHLFFFRLLNFERSSWKATGEKVENGRVL